MRNALRDAEDAQSASLLSLMPDPAASLLLKLRRRDDVSQDEASVLSNMVPKPHMVRAGQDIVKQGHRPRSSTLLVDGLAARYKVLKGGGRQITAIHVAGDFVDLHSFLLKGMDHGVTCLTDCRVAQVPHATLRQVSEAYPHLARLFWLLTLIDGAIHREWLVAMGRRSAKEHLAHLICELYALLEVVQLASDREFRLPITQANIADVLGLSTVHVNRVLQELREEELVSWHGTAVKILHWERLAAFAEFDPNYLNLSREPR